ncbi:arylsulfotransferase family protein [Natrinema sp. 1APR25-10V2]|uniref:arylsulfotransferase family protein n=1 Tax=Natrinema sp. 1APR25-10V2 TaxID=2951081 RepID=UPI0028769804|nr:arylsulfotransferase family protein [Natrinema sp. 1APR25-10V2]MDS0475644.1 arylsulfotransferase family protein [Natrinema sp. 1APR25-10V2]
MARVIPGSRAVRITRRRVRILFLTILVVSGAGIVYSAVADSAAENTGTVRTVPPAENHTVVTQSGRIGNIVAYAPNGSRIYSNDTHTKYYDVDPVANASMTVEYAATDTLYAKSPRCQDPPCARNVIERANLSTGEVTQVYSQYVYRETAGEWHDADRIDDRHFVVADIAADQVFVVDTETEMIEWTWDAQSEFPVSGGGSYPGNWVHLNDVEYIETGRMEGRVMVSLRNQDQVVFIDPETGMLGNRTLGAEDDYSILNEQHNPDYISGTRGGPAVVVADSENGRVQEFQRENGAWNRTWTWSDARLQWPRDADRLPGGNTLVTDTGGERVLEVNDSGAIVWQARFKHPYDAERLETGDESAGGRSAAALGLESRTSSADDPGGRDIDLGLFEPLVDGVRDLVPSRIVNALIHASPTWLGPSDIGPVIVALCTGLLWGAIELGWFLRARGVGLRSPVYRRER